MRRAVNASRITLHHSTGETCDWVDSMYERELATAIKASEKAASIARSRFGTILKVTAKGSSGDIVTDVDLECESEIVQIIRREHPLHAVVVEETEGYDATSRWTWIVDPLDGTNNYAHAFPVYGASVALCYDDEPVVASIAEGFADSVITAVKGSGVAVNGVPYEIKESVSPASSAALWLGYDVNRGGEMALSLTNTLARAMHRTFQNWAPTVDVGLYLRGGIDVIVGLNCTGTELPAALLVLSEAGARIVGVGRSGPVGLSRPPRLFVAGRDTAVTRVLNHLDVLAA